MTTTCKTYSGGLFFVAMLLALPAAAAVLDAQAAKSLTSDRTWQQKAPAGPGKVFWSWKADGSVCLRTDGKNSKCTDTGTWKLDGERLCYELTWWGESAGRKSSCFRISDQGKGRYEALQDNGLAFFEFSVAE